MNRRRRGTGNLRGNAKGTRENVAKGGTGSRFQVLETEMEEVEPVVPVILNASKEGMRTVTVDHGTGVSGMSGDGTDDSTVQGAGLSRPIGGIKETIMEISLQGTGQEIAKDTSMISSSGRSSGNKQGAQSNGGRVAALGKVVVMPTALG
ncbi:hypothetical protein V6N11_055053 [Hibiscus sabdariffa]